MNTATPRQEAFIKELIENRELTAEHHAVVSTARWAWRNNNFTKGLASEVIGKLLEAPRKVAAPIDGGTATTGVYQDEHLNLFRVYYGQQSKMLLVKEIQLDAFGELVYKYRGSAARIVMPHWHRLSLEEVGKLGQAWDHCLNCGRRLDDPESVDRGIGPVCAKNYDIVRNAA